MNSREDENMGEPSYVAGFGDGYQAGRREGFEAGRRAAAGIVLESANQLAAMEDDATQPKFLGRPADATLPKFWDDREG
jgi:flagellar biosynthesis/type III secretory pathway protein FliH